MAQSTKQPEPNVQSLHEQAKKLSIDDRTVLAHMIWESVTEECDDAPLTDAQREELEHRIAEWRLNPGKGSSWEDVKARLLARLD